MASGPDGRDARDWLRYEAKELERLAPGGIVPAVREVFEQGGHVFLVEDLIDGDTLQRWTTDRLERRHGDDGRIPVPVAWQLARELVRLVVRVHEESLVLRDFKPSNMMITPQGRPVLVDLEGAVPRRSRARDRYSWVRRARIPHRERVRAARARSSPRKTRRRGRPASGSRRSSAPRPPGSRRSTRWRRWSSDSPPTSRSDGRWRTPPTSCGRTRTRPAHALRPGRRLRGLGCRWGRCRSGSVVSWVAGPVPRPAPARSTTPSPRSVRATPRVRTG
ncbi:hypothetical protein EHYA_07895 [Embleya hyalina]|uniref:Protein kinase domain-containing protein n=1 Tax=Embleya hyalina TaxID=516124 RepID=A0A401YZW0_9ACTN|nr:hypothetical protein EHYA_07895 [Embleya hyalina]